MVSATCMPKMYKRNELILEGEFVSDVQALLREVLRRWGKAIALICLRSVERRRRSAKRWPRSIVPCSPAHYPWARIQGRRRRCAGVQARSTGRQDAAG